MGHLIRDRAGARPLHLAGCWCWSSTTLPRPRTATAPPFLTAQQHAAQVDAYRLAPPAPVLPARRHWLARVLLAGGLVEEVEPPRD